MIKAGPTSRRGDPPRPNLGRTYASGGSRDRRRRASPFLRGAVRRPGEDPPRNPQSGRQPGRISIETDLTSATTSRPGASPRSPIVSGVTRASKDAPSSAISTNVSCRIGSWLMLRTCPATTLWALVGLGVSRARITSFAGTRTRSSVPGRWSISGTQSRDAAGLECGQLAVPVMRNHARRQHRAGIFAGGERQVAQRHDFFERPGRDQTPGLQQDLGIRQARELFGRMGDV